MSEKGGKISISTFILTILLILSIVFIGVLGYININTYKVQDELNEKNENLENKLTSIETENKNLQAKVEQNNKIEDKAEDDINTNEKVVVYNLCNNSATKSDMLFYAYIDKGTLYYTCTDRHNNGMHTEFTKYGKINNFKKIVFWNEGTGVNPTAIALTEDGKIYQFNIYKCFKNASNMIEDLDLLSVTKDISNINDFKLESEDLTLYLRLSLKDGSDKKVELYKYPSGY